MVTFLRSHKRKKVKKTKSNPLHCYDSHVDQQSSVHQSNSLNVKQSGLHTHTHTQSKCHIHHHRCLSSSKMTMCVCVCVLWDIFGHWGSEQWVSHADHDYRLIARYPAAHKRPEQT